MRDATGNSPPDRPTDRQEHLPIPFFALVMGPSGRTLALHATETQARRAPATGHALLALTMAMFAVLAGFYVTRDLRHPAAVAVEWWYTVQLSVYPALTNSLLLIATALRPMSGDLARTDWPG